MTTQDIVLLGIAFGLTAVAMLPQVRTNTWWSATVTPLASIIGSGFLVIAPLLAAVAGSYAVAAMLGIIVLAYWVGSCIRFNITHAEPLEAGEHGPKLIRGIGRLSGAALSVAYVISVAFYIRLLASFALALTPINNPLFEDTLATAILVAIAGIGYWRGLRGLEVVETISVSIKLAIIVALLFGLLWFNYRTGIWSVELTARDHDPLTRLRMLAGMLLVVQGFETSRYLGHQYAAGLRRRSMNFAQLFSAALYLAFVALVMPSLVMLPSGPTDETAIIDITAHVAMVLPFMLILAALMSQLSAGIADTVGAGGLVVEESRGRIVERNAYPILVAFSIMLIWAFDIFEVISIASRTFASYYMLQAVITALVAYGQGKVARSFGAGLLALLLGLIVVFAIPAE